MNKEQLIQEIERLEKVMEKPAYNFPNTTRLQINALKRSLWWKGHPVLFKLLTFIGESLVKLGRWVAPFWVE